LQKKYLEERGENHSGFDSSPLPSMPRDADAYHPTFGAKISTRATNTIAPRIQSRTFFVLSLIIPPFI